MTQSEKTQRMKGQDAVLTPKSHTAAQHSGQLC